MKSGEGARGGKGLQREEAWLGGLQLDRGESLDWEALAVLGSS